MVSNFSSVPSVFHHCHFGCTSYVDLRFSRMSLRKASAVEGETESAPWLYHRYVQSMHLTEGVTVMSLSASILQKISLHMNHLCEIALNRKLLYKFEMCCKFLSCIKANLCNRSHSQLDLPVYKNMFLPFHLQLLQFQPCAKCVGQGSHLACFSAICWCDAICIWHFSLQMPKVQ